MGLFSHIVKPANNDRTAWEQRHLTMHGSSAKRGMAKWHGQSMRHNEKPSGWFGGSPQTKGKGR